MNKFNLVMTFILLAIMIRVIMRNNSENFQTNPQVALNNANLLYGNVPSGTIVSWCHDAQLNTDAKRLEMDNNANIPDGWVVCDGRSYTKTDGSVGYTPNLVGKFIYGGKGEAYANVNRQSGTPTGEYKNGNENNFENTGMYEGVPSSDHANVMYSNGKYKVALTETEMPRHNHGIPAYRSFETGRGTNGSVFPNNHLVLGVGAEAEPGVNNWAEAWPPSNYRGGPISSHPNPNTQKKRREKDSYHDGEGHQNMPPYYALVYIMKKY